jgi:hypothetical protein
LQENKGDTGRVNEKIKRHPLAELTESAENYEEEKTLPPDRGADHDQAAL